MSDIKMLTIMATDNDVLVQIPGRANQIHLKVNVPRTLPADRAYACMAVGGVVEVRDQPQEVEKADKKPAKKTDEKPAE